MMDQVKESGGTSNRTTAAGDCLMMRARHSDPGMRTADGIRLFDYCHQLMAEIKAARSSSSGPADPVSQQHQHHYSPLEDIEKQSDFLFRESPTSAEVERIGTVVRSPPPVRIKKERMD